MFGLFKSKKPYIQEKVESIAEEKPKLKPLIRDHVDIKNKIYLDVSQKLDSGEIPRTELLFMPTAHLPFFVGYIDGKQDEKELFRRSDAVDILLMLHYPSFPHLDEKQTNMMEKLCSELVDTVMYQQGKKYSVNASGGNILNFFYESCDIALDEIKEVVKRNS